MSVYIDLSEFFSRPHRTGIQRVTGELCWHWPGQTELIPVRITSDARMVRLPGNTLETVKEYFRSPTGRLDVHQERIREMVAASEGSPHVELRVGSILLCPEVFWDPARIYFYESQPPELHSCYRFLIYDLLVLTHPEYFVPDAPHQIICRYFRLLRDIPHVAFISEATRRSYYERLLRTSRLGGTTIRLGSDGLGPRPNDKRTRLPAQRFVVACTIEPRKNHALVLDALESILYSAPDVELHFLGRMGWAEPGLVARVKLLETRCPNFKVHQDVDDGTMRKHIEGARATIFVSAVEGFGLPPVESLWLGTPVIVSDGIPSLELTGDNGIVRVRPLDPAGLRDAAMAFLDDVFYEKKAAEARQLALPTWATFTSEISAWVDEVGLCA